MKKVTVNSFDFKKQGFETLNDFKVYLKASAEEDQKCTGLPLSVCKQNILDVLTENEPHTLKN